MTDGAARAASPRLVLILSENWTLWAPGDLRRLVDAAVQAEEAGFDAAMVSEHVVLGPGADANGVPENPRDYALPGNQDPSTPWPDAPTLLAAVASATTTLRLVASSIIAPLRHPLLLAKQLATLDLLSRGRMVVQPTVSWHRPEYEALGVPFERRGELLDEHLAAWRVLWRDTPASFDGRNYRFHDVWLEPKPFRPATTIPGEDPSVPDLVRRDFTAPAPGTKLVGDITYIPTWEGWLSLATVVDCFNREVIGYAMADHMRAELGL